MRMRTGVDIVACVAFRIPRRGIAHKLLGYRVSGRIFFWAGARVGRARYLDWACAGLGHGKRAVDVALLVRARGCGLSQQALPFYFGAAVPDNAQPTVLRLGLGNRVLNAQLHPHRAQIGQMGKRRVHNLTDML